MNYFVKFLSFAASVADVWNVIKNILLFIVVLGLIVGIHEFGHFIFARRAKILCREFAIGMGPKIVSKRKGETVYSLRAFPIGGFCAIAGEEVEEDPFKDIKKVKLDIQSGVIKGFYLDVDNEAVNYPVYEIVSYELFDIQQTGNLFMEVIEDSSSPELTKTYPVDSRAIIYHKKNEYQIAPYNRTLGSKNKRQRAMVMFGGPLMNFVLALFVFLIVGLFTGFVDTKSTEIGVVDSSIQQSENEKEILMAGDKILGLKTNTLGYKDITTWVELTEYMQQFDQLHLAEEITLTVDRNGEQLNILVSPFIAINSAGFGSTLDYLNETQIVIGAYGDITQDGIADNSQLSEGDIIISIWTYGSTPIENPTWEDIRSIFDEYVGDSDDDNLNRVYMKVKRGAETLDVWVMPYSKVLIENQTSLNGAKIDPTSATIGIVPNYKFSFIKSIGYSFERTWGSFTAVIDTFKLLFGGTVSIRNLSGPIGIYSITSNAAQYGPLYVLSLIGLLSVNIGFLNLFPIPALDGGRLLFLGYEAITKKKPNPKVETILITITMILLLGLMVFVAYEDILRLIK